MEKMVVYIVAALTMLLLMFETGESLTCEELKKVVVPCVPYVTGLTSAPSALCCDGIKNWNEIANTTEIRQMECNCAKEGAKHAPNLKEHALKDLPSKCNQTFSFVISKDSDCNS